MITRREALKLLAIAALAPGAGIAAPCPARVQGRRRLVIVFLRGGLDGLSAVAPFAEPAHARVRGALALAAPDGGGALKLDGMFAMHPQLASVHAMYRAGECVVLHATAHPCPVLSHLTAQKLLARPAAVLQSLSCGPRLEVIDMGGWDTHASQAAALSRNLRLLDRLLAGLKARAGPAWKDTAVLVVSEFGRTVAMNQWCGTDHGSASAAFVLGGAVRGGRLLADWPGLTASALYEGRALKATTDLRALFKAALIAQLNVAESFLETAIFPGSREIRPIEGLFG
jgi:uncharacterized protein (DUF1501 family)